MKRLLGSLGVATLGAMHGLVIGWWLGGFVLVLPQESILLVAELAALASIALGLAWVWWPRVRGQAAWIAAYAVLPPGGLAGGLAAWITGQAVQRFTGQEWSWLVTVHVGTLTAVITAAVVAWAISRRRAAQRAVG